MKKTLVSCFLGLLFLVTAAWSQEEKAPKPAVTVRIGNGDTEKAVAAMEQQWLQSEKTNNPDLVAPLLAEKFVNTDDTGNVSGKTAMLADAKATRYESVSYGELKVTAFGDTAIATGDFTAKGTDSSGKPMDVHERFTDTWVKMPNGKWQCVASHQSPIKM